LEADLKGLFEKIPFYPLEGSDPWTLESILQEICGKGSMYFGTNPPRGLWRRDLIPFDVGTDLAMEEI